MHINDLKNKNKNKFKSNEFIDLPGLCIYFEKNPTHTRYFVYKKRKIFFYILLRISMKLE